MCFGNAKKENNGTEEISLVNPTTELCPTERVRVRCASFCLFTSSQLSACVILFKYVKTYKLQDVVYITCEHSV